MDTSRQVLFSFIGTVVTILIIVILFMINNLVYPQISLTPVAPPPGLPQNGISGSSGYDGALKPLAVSGSPGLSGEQGFNGRRGKDGKTGLKGLEGDRGISGLSGSPGLQGSWGPPSNSTVPVISRYGLSLTDSYSLQDTFTVEGTKYQVSMFANIENNSRFTLPGGEKVIVPQTGFAEGLATAGLPVTNLAGGTFYSNLRIAVCYGKGKSSSTVRSDDTVFYVSPPISRRTFLFRYRILKDPGQQYLLMDVNFPKGGIMNRNKEFLFFKTEKSTNEIEDSLDTYHLFKGLGRYELVVNTYPPLRSEISGMTFNYRIIEEYSFFDETKFALPMITLPFNAGSLSFSGDPTMCISNRFDLNKVIERDYTYDKSPWKQTSKRTVEIAVPDKTPKVPFENTYNSLSLEHDASVTLLNNTSYYLKSSGETKLRNEKHHLPLTGYLHQNNIKVPIGICLALRNYTPAVPLIKFRSNEKLYLKFDIENSLSSSNSEGYYTFTYGGDGYSKDAVNFRSVYGKSIFISRYWHANSVNLDTTNTLKMAVSSDSKGTDHIVYTAAHRVAEVGYILPNGTRYTKKVLPQNCYNPSEVSCFINIPLYGYKKG